MTSLALKTGRKLDLWGQLCISGRKSPRLTLTEGTSEAIPGTSGKVGLGLLRDLES